MNDLLDAALTYAAKGWRVIPLARSGKIPLTPHGLKDGTTDEDQIRFWWRQWPDANIGLLTGEHFDVLDVDGEAGMASLEKLGNAGHYVASGTLQVQTGGGGWHFLFEPLGAGNRAGMMPGLDWRGVGGYIVAPPSLHSSGRRYKKLTGVGPTPAPGWLRELVNPEPASVRPSEPSEWTSEAVSPAYVQRAVDAELAALATAPDGTRNHALNKAAFSLYGFVKADALDRSILDRQLYEVASRIGLGGREIQRTLASAWDSATARSVTVMDRLPEVDEPAGPAPRLELISAASIVPRRTRWLWEGRLPTGSLSLIGGREGIGKSTAAYDLVAALTKGKLPGEYFGRPKSALICASEDDWAMTIVPRLMAAGADLNRVWRIDVHAEGQLQLPRDIDSLAQLVPEHDVALILLDPLMSRLGKLDTHKDSEVRQGLEPMSELAIKTDCSVLGIIHVNKSGSNDPLTSLMGSRAFSAVARSVLYVMIDPEDETHGGRILALVKNNLGRMDIPALKFIIEDRYVADDPDDGTAIHSGKVCWGEESMIDIFEAMEQAGRSSAEKTAQQEVAEWLLDYLRSHGGVDESKTIKAEARKEGYTISTLDIAKNKLGIVIERLPGRGAPTAWRLPKDIVAGVAEVVPESWIKPAAVASAGDLI